MYMHAHIRTATSKIGWGCLRCVFARFLHIGRQLRPFILNCTLGLATERWYAPAGLVKIVHDIHECVIWTALRVHTP